jgi:DNA-binding XRE family transcriptional regulator
MKNHGRDDGVPRLRIKGSIYYLVPAAHYRRLVRDSGRELVDATDYARASIGLDLRRGREKAGLTQAQVAAKSGLRLETISRLENGKGNPTVSTVRRILASFEE